MQGSKKYIFFIGSHRTGSKAMAQFANSLEDTSCIHQNRSHLFINLVSYAYLNGVLPKVIFNKFIDLLLIQRLKNTNSKCVIETNGFNMVAINRVLQTFDNVKIIHIVRDPRTFVSSMKNWREKRKVKNFIQENLPFWDVGPHLLKLKKKHWKRKSIKQKFAHRWAFKNDYISHSYGKFEAYKLIKFEEFFDANKTENTYEILTWAGMTISKKDIELFIAKKVNNSSALNEQNHWSNWPICEILSLHQICHLQNFGYLQDDAWQTIITQNIPKHFTN